MIDDDKLANYGIIIQGVRNISSREALELCQLGAIILDVRPLYESDYRAFGVPEVFLAPAAAYDDWISNLPKDRCMIVADATGLKSRLIARRLLDDGFSLIVNLSGGIVDWERSGAPVRVNKESKLTGSCLCQLKPRYKKEKDF
ncbi:MAG: rhodanese-like domain-containing protein [Bacteroidales bacterium]